MHHGQVYNKSYNEIICFHKIELEGHMSRIYVILYTLGQSCGQKVWPIDLWNNLNLLTNGYHQLYLAHMMLLNSFLSHFQLSNLFITYKMVFAWYKKGNEIKPTWIGLELSWQIMIFKWRTFLFSWHSNCIELRIFGLHSKFHFNITICRNKYQPSGAL